MKLRTKLWSPTQQLPPHFILIFRIPIFFLFDDMKGYYLPSRTSQWYACRYHRTCRSSLEVLVSWSWTARSWMILTTGGGGLAGVDVADNDDVDVGLFLTGRKSVDDLGRHTNSSEYRMKLLQETPTPC